jgi:two-component system CheB/CheR fusion protein
MTSNDKNANNARKKATFPVVGIGAAAGGEEAITELLQHLPHNTGMSFFYVQHPEVSPNGHLIRKLSGLTELKVVKGDNNVSIEPDHLYILPHDKELKLEDGLLKEAKTLTRGYSAMPINSFFTGLAETYHEKAIGILLSGGTVDGVVGMKAIKLAGGITFAQDESAQFQTMTKTAIAEGAADRVLSPKDLAKELSEFARKNSYFSQVITQMNDEQISDVDENLIGILSLINRSTGVDFSQYKMNTIKRRIIRRMMLYKVTTLAEYLAYLKEHLNEVAFLYQDLLINVTYFFRDEETMEYLKDVLLPKIIRTKSSTDPIRIWVPACSTGQEAYSLAILIMEILGENASNIPVQIFATDLSEFAITKARLGVYTRDEVLDVSPERLERFFNKLDGQYRIIKSIRDLCVFANHNVAKDPPFSRLDLISCCNLMIYLDTQLQKRLIATFHYSLRNIGYLVLGKSETVGTSDYLFTQVDKKTKVFIKKKDVKAKALFEMNYKTHELIKNVPVGVRMPGFKMKNEDQDVDKAVDTLLLKKFTPASVVVNLDLDILQFRGSTGLYLEPSPGKASLNLMKMAKPGLGFELRNIVHKAKKSGEAVQKTSLEITSDEKPRWVSIEAIPLRADGEELFLVVFEEVKTDANEYEVGALKDQRVSQLNIELATLREDMRSIVEAQEAANEELQSANEEIVSSNEELQSINEELETSKEEIESSNEELITINQELQLRNDQLAESQQYSFAVFTTIRESLIILDKDLRVKSANKSFYKIFGLLEEETEGRLIFDIGNQLWNIPKFKELLEEILPKNGQYFGYEIKHYFPGIGEKNLLLNARRINQKSNNQDIFLIAIEDLTEYKQAQAIIAEKEAWFRNMANNLPVMIWVTGIDKLCNFVNKTFLDFRGVGLEEVVGKSWTLDAHPDDEERIRKIYEENFNDKKEFELIYRLKHHDGSYKQILSKGKPNYSSSGAFTGFIGSCVELDENVKKEISD